MTIHINEAFRPIFLTYFFVGLCIYPIKEFKPPVWWVVYISILYSLIIWFVYGYVLYYLITIVSLETLFKPIIMSVILIINIITTLTTMIVSMYHRKRYRICMNRLAVIDDTLEKLGSPKIYRKIRVRSKRIVIGWIIRSLAINSYNILWWLNRKETAPWAFIISHIINHCANVNMFVDLVYLNILWYIGNRFDNINKHMRYLIAYQEHKLRKWKKPIITVHQYIPYCDNYKRILWSSMHLHLELCHVAREINIVCGTQMTFEMVTYLLFLTALCYHLYKFIQMEERQENVPVTSWFHIIIWSFDFVARLWAISYICENISTKAKEIDKIIHQLTNNDLYADIGKEIQQFSLQIMHHPLKFTGMGLFYFGNEFLRKFFMTIVTFVILIVQMSEL